MIVIGFSFGSSNHSLEEIKFQSVLAIKQIVREHPCHLFFSKSQVIRFYSSFYLNLYFPGSLNRTDHIVQ